MHPFVSTCAVTTTYVDAQQLHSSRIVAAFEVPLPSEAERGKFLSPPPASADLEGNAFWRQNPTLTNKLRDRDGRDIFFAGQTLYHP